MLMHDHRRPALARLCVVELRKAAGSRAGAALLATVAGLSVVAAAGQLAYGPAADRTLGSLTATAQWPVSVVLPVVGVLAVTTEFSRRTALATFALVPTRGRVVVAKAIAMSVLALAATLWATGAAAAGFALGAVAGRTVDGSALTAEVVAQLGLVNMVTMLCGVAFGLLLRHSVPATVTFYVVPIAWSAAGRLIPGLGSVASWLDIGQSRIPLVEPGVSGREWAMFATSCLLWVGLPAAIGALRVHRADLA